jgi:RNA polymerase sigma-70 factor (ECF subfamily)
MDDLLLGIEREIPALRRYAQVLARDPDTADDLVQDCLVRALSRTHLWRQPGNLRAWLFTILRNIHLNQRRSLARNPPPLSLVEGYEPSTASDQISRVEAAEVLGAFRQLPDEQREVLFLIVAEGLRYREAAALLGISISTLTSRLARSRERLRQLVDEHGPAHCLRSIK